MLKDELKELYVFLDCLKRGGYFDPEPTKTVAPLSDRRFRGPAVTPQNKGRKLTRHEAVEIYREDRYSPPEIAELYNVHESTVYDIKCGRTWSLATGQKKSDKPLRAVGIKNGKKLNSKQVLEIYREKELSNAEIAEIYDISTVSVQNIKAGRAWPKVTGHKK
jgi:predicted DNA-binding protein YlxM (UPF0122 family)